MSSNWEALSARYAEWIRAHQKTVFIMRNVGVYGLATIWLLVKATLIAVFAGIVTYIAQLVMIATSYQALMPDAPLDDVDFEPSMSPTVFVMIVVWIGSVLVYTWRLGQGTRRFSVRTPFGSTEHVEWRSMTHRAHELVLQAVVARSLGSPVLGIELPLNGIGYIHFSHYQSRLETGRDRMIAACALSIAANALHQDHAMLDSGIAADATSEDPEGFTRDEIIREAARAVARARVEVSADVRDPIERELRYLGRISGARLEELLSRISSREVVTV